jgi:hypothetical protein
VEWFVIACGSNCTELILTTKESWESVPEVRQSCDEVPEELVVIEEFLAEDLKAAQKYWVWVDLREDGTRRAQVSASIKARKKASK